MNAYDGASCCRWTGAVTVFGRGELARICLKHLGGDVRLALPVPYRPFYRRLACGNPRRPSWSVYSIGWWWVIVMRSPRSIRRPALLPLPRRNARWGVRQAKVRGSWPD